MANVTQGLDASAPFQAREREAAESRSRADGGTLAWVILKYGLLTLGALLIVLPFADMLLGALRTPAERLARPPVYWPATPQWENFERAFRELPMARWIGNSVLVTGVITAIQLATSSMAGFALAKYEFWGRDTLFRFVLGAQMFPFFLLIIPMFFILRFWPLAGGNDVFGQGGTGFLNTYTALILPFSVSWFGIFLMRQFIITIPDELLDAARIDGAGEYRIFFLVIVPMLKPAFVTLGLFIFIYHWNEVIWTMTVTRSAQDLQTLPVGIHLMRGEFVDERTRSLQQAALAVSIVPAVALFLALQRFYVRGLVVGGAKG